MLGLITDSVIEDFLVVLEQDFNPSKVVVAMSGAGGGRSLLLFSDLDLGRPRGWARVSWKPVRLLVFSTLSSCVLWLTHGVAKAAYVTTLLTDPEMCPHTMSSCL